MRRIHAFSATFLCGVGIGSAPAFAASEGEDFSNFPPVGFAPAASDSDLLDELGGQIADAQGATDDIAEDEASIIDDSELQQQRGGFAVGGLNISLGADIKTFINDELALHTVVSWSDRMVSETQVLSAALTLADANNLRDQVLATGNIRMQVGNDAVYLANDGQTAISHRTDGGLQNVLFNTANGLVARQEVNATLNVSNYSGFANNIQNVQLNNLFGYIINDAIVSFGG